jgi:hemoglobin-like flavoprotein
VSAPAAASSPAIEASLELAAERAGDITPLVYDRLFAGWPEMEALFVRDTDGAVRGQMLAQVFEALLDFSGRRYFSLGLIQTEIVNHEGLGVPPDVFARFFAVVRDTVREACGADWTAGMEAAWSRTLAEADALFVPAA